MSQLVDTWQNLDLRRRIVLVAAVLLTFVAVFSVAQIASRPGMALLYSGVDPAASGEVLAALEQMNVQADVRGDAIYVPEGERDRVRLALARDGLPRQGQAGYELLDQISGFSSTSDMFNAAYWRAKEGELARTILASPGVRAARVHIAVPSRRPFATSGAEPTASVTVTMAGGVLTPEQANAIRFVTALAVANLDPDQVAVIDSRAGMVLAPGSESVAGSAATQAAEREVKLKAEVEELLAARVGRDRARVTVTVETERESKTILEKQIDPESRVVIHSNTEEISDSSQGSAGSVTVASNLPDGDANAQNNRSAARTESREQSNFDYSERQIETVREVGTIRRISVAVLVDGIITQNAAGESQWQPRPEEELAELRDLVVAAVGYDEARGDIVEVKSMAFQPDATPGALVEVGPIVRFLERNAMTLIQLAFLAVVVGVLAMTVIRPLLTRRPPGNPEEGFALTTTGTPGLAGQLTDEEMATMPPLAALTQTSEDEGTADLDPTKPPGQALRDLIADRPEKAAEMLTMWLDEQAEQADRKMPSKELA